MDRIENILVAVDFSPCAADAVRQAIRIGARHAARVRALHVVDLTPFMPLGDPISGGGPPMVPVDSIIDAARRSWAAFLADEPGRKDITLDVEVGNPRERILERVLRDRPDLLIVGAHSTQDKFRSIGTTAAACVQRAACRVLVVREGQRGPFRSVLACVDFGETARIAVGQAVRAAAEDGAALHVLNVYQDPWHAPDRPRELRDTMPDFEEKLRAALEGRLHEHCRPFAADMAGLNVAYHAVAAPRHSEGIIDFIRRHGCDLVVLGTRAKRNFRDFFWGSTAERVARDAPCSVLAVKPPGFSQMEPYQRLESTAPVDAGETDLASLQGAGRA